ncbi:hypothetical protein [Coleofasciculus sp. FACHB-T130]|uniref:hypothetical protein n=1 Tax=Cyanophyceae TaxID=3028117 RepID=UPI0016836159|nr:hypothetical protein [Coleofasciculus sp. FACHB-T130]MBD1882137.1 hypothetical protein [Coleofasciculus sp. FACHB-T130]
MANLEAGFLVIGEGAIYWFGIDIHDDINSRPQVAALLVPGALSPILSPEPPVARKMSVFAI